MSRISKVIPHESILAHQVPIRFPQTLSQMGFDLFPDLVVADQVDPILIEGSPGVVWSAGGVVCVKGAGLLEEAEEGTLDVVYHGPAGLVYSGE